MWAACALVLASAVLAVGLLSPARAAWGVGSVSAGGLPGSTDRRVSMCAYAQSFLQDVATGRRRVAAAGTRQLVLRPECGRHLFRMKMRSC